VEVLVKFRGRSAQSERSPEVLSLERIIRAMMDATLNGAYYACRRVLPACARAEAGRM